MDEQFSQMKKMFSVLVPVTLQQLVISMNFIIDNLMVSYLGEEFIAALGSSNKFMVIVRMSIIAICSASGSLISQYRGSRHKEGVSRTFAINSIITFSTAMIFCIIFFTNKDFILSSFSDSKEIVLISWSYLSIIIFTSFSFSLIMPMMTVVRSTGNVVSALLVSVISLFTNFIFNFILIYGKFGIPALGIRGAAISTVISEVLSIIILLAIVNYKITPISKIKDIDFSFKDIDKFLRVSLPLLSAGLLTSLSLMFSHNIFGRLGEEELAAYGIISPMENILSDLFAGVGLASIVIIGAELGRNKFESAYSHAKSIIWSGLASSLIIGSCFIFFSSKVTWFLDIDEETVGYVVTMLTLLGISMPVRTFNSTMSNGMLSSGGDNVFLMFVTMTADWIFALPSIYIGKYLFNWNIPKIYSVLILSEILTATIFIFRFRSKRWMTNLVGG